MTLWILWFLMDIDPEEPAWQGAGLGLPSDTRDVGSSLSLPGEAGAQASAQPFGPALAQGSPRQRKSLSFPSSIFLLRTHSSRASLSCSASLNPALRTGSPPGEGLCSPPQGVCLGLCALCMEGKALLSLAKGCQHLGIRGGAGTQGGVSTFSKRGNISPIGTP